MIMIRAIQRNSYDHLCVAPEGRPHRAQRPGQHWGMLILKPLSIDWSVAGAKIPAVTFIAQAGLPARELAHMLDSLVRVSRRVE